MPAHQVRERHECPSVVECTCGWRSEGLLDPDLADERWRIHAQQQRTARWTAKTSQQQSIAQVRATELSQLRDAMCCRREAIIRQRILTRSALSEARRFASRMRGGPQSRARTLELARRFADYDLAELWTNYVGIGGDATYAELTGMLAGDRIMRRVDHDLLVCVLNERFEIAGFGRPVEFWGQLD